MSITRDPETVIGAWLDEGPRTLPHETRQAITVGVRAGTRPQPRIGWPFTRQNQGAVDLRRLSLALGSAVVLVLAVALAVNFLANRQGIGALPTPSPTPPASPTGQASGCPDVWRTGQLLGCSRDGTRLLIQKGNENLFVVHADGSETQVTEQLLGIHEMGSARPTGATISPDGSRVVYADLTKTGLSCHNGALFAVDADGGPAELLWESQRDGIVRYPVFSPDGTQIAFSDGYCDSDHSVWVMNADGSDAHQIVSSDMGQLGATWVHGLAWSAAGDRIALQTSDGVYNFATDGSDFRTTADWSEYCWPGQRCSASPAELLDAFLEARVAGVGAEAYLNHPAEDIPLLYATNSGARYERAEWERVLGIEWPHGRMAFKLRLIAADTVVEQLVFTSQEDGLLRLGYQADGFGTDIAPTSEDGWPVAVAYNVFGGQVTLSAAHPWIMTDYYGFPFGRLIPEGPGVPPTTDAGQRQAWDSLALLADPVLGGPGCQSGSDQADAAALAETIRSDPAMGASTPVAVSVEGAEALMMDVVIAPGATIDAAADMGNLCPNGVLGSVYDRSTGTIGTGVARGQATGDWVRLYLFDVPEGLSMRILAIAIVAPEASFERAVEAAWAIVESIEFHAP